MTNLSNNIKTTISNNGKNTIKWNTIGFNFIGGDDWNHDSGKNKMIIMN